MFRTTALVFALVFPTLALAGAEGGPKLSDTHVYAQDSDVYTVTFRAGEPAQVAVSGDGDTDLDVFVYDENGNLVASDLSTSDQAAVSWTPRWTGEFRIEIKNRGGVYNQYTLLTN